MNYKKERKKMMMKRKKKNKRRKSWKLVRLRTDRITPA
jgi:hypothetical protein